MPALYNKKGIKLDKKQINETWQWQRTAIALSSKTCLCLNHLPMCVHWLAGNVWYGMVRYGMVRYGQVWYGKVWYVWLYGMFGMACLVIYGMARYGMFRYGIVMYGIFMYGQVWSGMTFEPTWRRGSSATQKKSDIDTQHTRRKFFCVYAMLFILFHISLSNCKL